MAGSCSSASGAAQSLQDAIGRLQSELAAEKKAHVDDEARLEAEGAAMDPQVADAEGTDPHRAQDERPPDQEEWASLIRRMLAVYRQVGPR